MIGVELPVTSGQEAVRLLGALGRHRYVAGRTHLVHALLYGAVFASDDEAAASPRAARLADGRAWAGRAASGVIPLTSRDERLWRRATDDEVSALLEVYWSDDESARGAKDRLLRALEPIDATVGLPPFGSEHDESDIFPILVDCGWELHPLCALDPDRHRGAIDAFGPDLAFEIARFEETMRTDGGDPPVYLQELTALGPAELLHGTDAEGRLTGPLDLWSDGPAPYLDYILRGALKSAKIG